MPEDKLSRPSKSSDNKKKKKKKRLSKVTGSNTPLENAEQPETVSLHPEISALCLLPHQSPNQDRGLGSKLRATSKKDGDRVGGSGRRRKKHPKDCDSSVSLTATNKNSDHSAVAQGYIDELSAKESLRWEGALEDPQAEEKRLELYRANRRQRYIIHRETFLQET